MSVHVFVVHFPLALILVAAGADLLGAAMKSYEMRQWATALFILGAFAGLLAFITGGDAIAAMSPMPQEAAPLVDVHSQWGGAGIWPIVGLGMLRIAWRRRLDGPYGWGNLAAVLVSAAVVIGISMSGMVISHG